MQVFSPTFTHFFVEFCRDRRLRAFSKILARSLFSFPCLSQILSSTPVTMIMISIKLLLAILLEAVNHSRDSWGPSANNNSVRIAMTLMMMMMVV